MSKSKERHLPKRPRVPSTRKGKDPVYLAPIPIKPKRPQEKRGS